MLLSLKQPLLRSRTQQAYKINRSITDKARVRGKAVDVGAAHTRRATWVNTHRIDGSWIALSAVLDVKVYKRQPIID